MHSNDSKFTNRAKRERKEATGGTEENRTSGEVFTT